MSLPSAEDCKPIPGPEPLPAPMTRLTIRQAAEALGVSKRTVKRRVDAGDLSATLERRGQRDVWTVDAAELARYAQATGQTVAVPGQEGGHGGATGGAVPQDTSGMVAADQAALRQEVGHWRALAASKDDMIAALRDRIAAQEAQMAFLQEQVRHLTTRALPPARQEGRSWWRRAFGGRSTDRGGPSEVT